MANNYFGFTHGGTQYSAQPTSAYPAAAAQTAYVQPAQPTAYAAAPRPQAYETYQSTAHSATGQYAYATRTQVAPQAAATYDASKTYYAQTAAAPAAAQTAVYTVAEPAYQTVSTKQTYPNQTFQTQTNTARTTHTQKVSTPAHSTSGSYVYQNTTTTPSSSRYDAAVYSAATSYYQQQQAKTTTGGGGGGSGSGSGSSGTTGGSSWQNKKPYQQKPKPKLPPKANQLHYCEVCKISCAGPQTYREHLEGQKHKKKETSSKGATVTPPARGMNTLRCELCDVACTGADAYAAHIRGAKHQKVLKLHTKLGKPIPSTDPVVIAPGSSTTSSTAKASSSTTATKSTTPGKPVQLLQSGAAASAAAAIAAKKVVATPKITFVGGTTLKTTGAKTEEVKAEAKTEPVVSSPVDDKVDDILLPGEKDVVPVGQEYIEEVRNEFGNVVSFHCKLCECKFNDPNAKIMHMKGRRHRLQYKKKVDPKLQVEVKPSIRARKIQEEKLRRQAAKEEYWRRRDAEERWRLEWEQRRYEEEVFRWGHGRGGPGPFPGGAGGPMPMRRPDTSDDRHVMAKHAAIYPTEQELQAVQNIVSSCEKSLKLVSDSIAECDAPKPMDTDKKDIKKEVKKEKDEKDSESEKKEGEKEEPPPRALKGVMRVGVLAKGLLLHNDLNVKLVVLCTEKPTRTLLERIADNLPKHLAEVADDKFEVKMCVEEASVIVSSEKDAKTSCTITMTSPVMRDENTIEGESSQSKPDPPDVLDRQKCLEALAALRHAKWFQARANGLQSCVVVIRTLRDLCQRVPTWTPLTQWAMELLAEKCVSSGGGNMSPGDALRRVFECIASGILLPGGPGLYDPCEKEPTDAAAILTNQEREDITASSQHALRLIAFRQIHKVLGMDALPAPKFQQRTRTNRKRRRTNSTGEGTESEGADGKKDKKEGEADGMEASGTDSSQQC